MSRIRIDFRFEGANEVLREFNRFDRDSRVALRKAVKKFGTKIGKAARLRAPVQSGALKKSIKAKYARDGLSADLTAGNRKVFYAHMVEFGTVREPARPFLFPAAEENREAYLAALREAIRGAI